MSRSGESSSWLSADRRNILKAKTVIAKTLPPNEIPNTPTTRLRVLLIQTIFFSSGIFVFNLLEREREDRKDRGSLGRNGKRWREREGKGEKERGKEGGKEKGRKERKREREGKREGQRVILH